MPIWSLMDDGKILVAIVAAAATSLAAVIAAGISYVNANRSARSQRELAAQLRQSTKEIEELRLHSAKDIEELRVSLAEAKEIRSEDRSRRTRANEFVTRYREPLLSAAFELQSRLYNIGRGTFFRNHWTESKQYARDHTLYVFAQYLGWREIVRQDVQFLDLGEEPATRGLAERLEETTHALSAGRLSVTLRLFRGEQRAIGEKMIVSAADVTGSSGPRGCMGYASFVESLREPGFAVWFEKLDRGLEDLATARQPDYGRVWLLQNALMDLIDQLDQDDVRFPAHLRRKLPLPSNLEAVLRRGAGRPG